jgi:hypothetical protein
VIPKTLISIGDAWVDPDEVIAVDTWFDADAPNWANCRVMLRNGQILYGLRAPARVAGAIRRPESDRYDEEHEREEDGSVPETAAERARRRTRPPVNADMPRPLRGRDECR